MLRAVLSAAVLACAALAVAPAVAALPDVSWCVGHKEGMCGDGDDVLVLDAGSHHVDVCVIGVAGSCDPYWGDLVRVNADGNEYVVPDPCYTTACF